MTRAEIAGRLDASRALYDELVAYARSDFPYEVCGLLAIRDGHLERFYPVRNAERSMTAYRMDPESMGPPYLAIDQDDELDLGVFHSHPHTEAFPSATDVAEAAYNPHAVFLICSLQDPDNPVIRVFDIRDGRITERVFYVDGEEAPTGSR
ncbi:MAG TPA: M67 family metallopeptidase [Egibacteraceae bacterium]